MAIYIVKQACGNDIMACVSAPERFSSLEIIYRSKFVNKPQPTFQDGLKVAMMLAMETVEGLW